MKLREMLMCLAQLLRQHRSIDTRVREMNKVDALVMESSSLPMARLTLDSGKRVLDTVLVSSTILMALFTRDFGTTISSMDQENSGSPMVTL